MVHTTSCSFRFNIPGFGRIGAWKAYGPATQLNHRKYTNWLDREPFGSLLIFALGSR